MQPPLPVAPFPVYRSGLAAVMAAWVSISALMAQAPGVKIVRDRGEQLDALVKQANEYRQAGALLSLDEVQRQCSRSVCSLKLPKPATKRLTEREIWRRTEKRHGRSRLELWSGTPPTTRSQPSPAY